MMHLYLEKNYACELCFQDQYLIGKIREEGSIANCCWCGSTKVRVLPLLAMGESFRKLVSIYKEVDGFNEVGGGIEDLLQQDWEIFSGSISESQDILRKLTLAILRAGVHPKHDVDFPDYEGNFENPSSWLDVKWERKMESLLKGSDKSEHKDDSMCSVINALPDDDNVLEMALGDLADTYSEGKIFYRARIHEDRLRTEWFGLEELHAPLPEKAKAGRGNRNGEPALYLAMERETAISEVRPWKHAIVAIGEHVLCERIQIVNLLKDDSPVSPFLTEYLAWHLERRALLHRLAEELSRPIIKGEEETLYKPTQNGCDFLKAKGFDGVLYPSGMEKGGFNLILFDTSKTRVQNITYERIEDIVNKSKTVEKGEVLYDPFPYDHC